MKKLLSLTAMFFMAVAVATAQPPAEPPAGPDPGGPDPLNPLAIPVDGGVSLLLAAGASFGARKLKGFGAKQKD